MTAMLRPFRGERALLVICAILLVFLYGFFAWRSTLPLLLNFNEGWNAYFAEAARAGALYPPPCAAITNNYPPLSFLLVGALTRIVPDAIFAGRIVAWVALAAVALFLYAIPRASGADRVAALFAPILFLGMLAVQFHHYIGVDDPQMLGHALSLAGLLLLVRDDGKPSAIGAALLVAVGLFVKHSLLGIPIAASLWLLRYQPRRGLVFVVVLAFAGITGLAATYGAFGYNFVAGLGAPRVWSAVRAYRYTILYLFPVQVPLALPALILLRPMRDRHAALLLLYAVASLMVGALGAAGSGVSHNAFFDLFLAVSLAGAHALTRFSATLGSGARAPRLLTISITGGALVLLGLLNAPRDVILVRPWVRETLAEAARVRATVAVLRVEPDPVICEDLALCYWAKRGFAVDIFNQYQGFLSRACDETPFLRRLAAGGYSAIALAVPAASDVLLTPRTRAAIRAHYAAMPGTNNLAATILLPR